MCGQPPEKLGPHPWREAPPEGQAAAERAWASAVERFRERYARDPTGTCPGCGRQTDDPQLAEVMTNAELNALSERFGAILPEPDLAGLRLPPLPEHRDPPGACVDALATR